MFEKIVSDNFYFTQKSAEKYYHDFLVDLFEGKISSAQEKFAFEMKAADGKSSIKEVTKEIEIKNLIKYGEFKELTTHYLETKPSVLQTFGAFVLKLEPGVQLKIQLNFNGKKSKEHTGMTCGIPYFLSNQIVESRNQVVEKWNSGSHFDACKCFFNYIISVLSFVEHVSDVFYNEFHKNKLPENMNTPEKLIAIFCYAKKPLDNSIKSNYSFQAFDEIRSLRNKYIHSSDSGGFMYFPSTDEIIKMLNHVRLIGDLLESLHEVYQLPKYHPYIQRIKFQKILKQAVPKSK